MSQKMMLLFSAGALFLLLPLFGDLVRGEISTDFHQCLHFFYKGIKPSAYTGTKYQPICQYYKKEYRFATMYHRDHRTPAYSAYRLKVRNETGERNDWKYEPQLVDVNSKPQMKKFQRIIGENLTRSQAIPEDYSVIKKYLLCVHKLVSEDRSPEMDNFPKTPDEDLKKSQAVLQDYESSSSNPEYTKGHLAPVSHQRTLVDREATYTLTNIVPQKQGSNNGPWSDLENRMLDKLNRHCRGEMYVITGIIPYEKVRKLKERVSIPEYMWSAYCCPTYIPAPNEHFDHTYAAVGRNDPDSGDDIVKKEKNSEGYDVKEMTVEALEKILRKRMNLGVAFFKNNCPKKK